MLLFSLYAYCKGYLIITITGNYTERFLNVCAAQNILLWDIVKVSPKIIRCKISVHAFRKLPKITFNTAVSVKIIAKCGLPFILDQYKHRKIILAGALILVIFMITANQFIWNIEVRGNETVKTQEILSALEAEGVKIGIPKAKIDQRIVKNKVMISLPSLSWLWIDKHGSKLIVDVRERVPVPEIFNPDDYCNITAAKDGVIESMIVRNGIPVVNIGDTVLKDTVLVTGKIPNASKPETRYVQSDAQVFARVWYEKRKHFPLASTIRTQTGKHKTLYTLNLFGKNIPIFHAGQTPYENSDKIMRKHEFSLFGQSLGISLTSLTYEEVTLSREKHTEESVASQGVKILKDEIDSEVLPDSALLAVSDTYNVIDDNTIEVIVKAEYKEDIAVKVKEEINSTDIPEESTG